MTGPLSAILTAVDSGARSLLQISRATGLDRGLVEAGVDHLVSTGRLRAEPLASGCPAGACGGCALLSAGCTGAVQVPSRARTLVLTHSR